MEYVLSRDLIEEQLLEIIVEDDGHDGVKHVAEWLARDISNVFGVKPQRCLKTVSPYQKHALQWWMLPHMASCR